MLRSRGVPGYPLCMPRIARVIIPGLPHHVTQRGNRRELIFFENGDQDVYCDLLSEHANKCHVEVWAYCLMPNHVHLIMVPEDKAGLARAIGTAHRRYTHFINARGRWTGHLFQSRFASVAMDETHLRAAVRYVSLNPVRARLVARAEDWEWSSVRAHLKGEDDGLVNVKPVLERVSSFAEFLATGNDESFAALRTSEGTGRPLGNADFIAGLERVLGRRLAKREPGRKARIQQDRQGVLL